MRLIHLLQKHWEHPFTGVCRFSRDFKKAFPEVVNIKSGDQFEWADGDVAVTDNHYSLMIPERVPTIVVMHGCAPFHYEVDEAWRSHQTEHIATGQRLQFQKSNRLFVAPSLWIEKKFRGYTSKNFQSVVIPHHAELIPTSTKKPIIIGDFRTVNKGSEIWREVAKHIDMELRQINFDPNDNAAREKTYSEASAYLCLSLSEGAPYSVADAEAASLPIASTNVGNVEEFNPVVIDDRDDVAMVRFCLETALANQRQESFYKTFPFAAWQQAWRVVIAEMKSRK